MTEHGRQLAVGLALLDESIRDVQGFALLVKDFWLRAADHHELRLHADLRVGRQDLSTQKIYAGRSFGGGGGGRSVVPRNRLHLTCWSGRVRTKAQRFRR